MRHCGRDASRMDGAALDARGGFPVPARTITSGSTRRAGRYCRLCGLIVKPEEPLSGGSNRPKVRNKPAKVARIAERDYGNPQWLVCFYCNSSLAIEEVTLDHYRPLAEGRHWNIESNLRIACVECNQVKGDKDPEAFRRSEYVVSRQRHAARFLARWLVVTPLGNDGCATVHQA